jgi:hypothetical protein
MFLACSTPLRAFGCAAHPIPPIQQQTDLIHSSVCPASCLVLTGRTSSDIKCHCCHGIGHFQHDCPSKKSYIATANGSYVSGSDTEDDLALQTNHVGDLADGDDDE